MWVITLVRVCITLTFLILALGGPYAVVRLNRFMALYAREHRKLKSRVEMIERHLSIDVPKDLQ